MNSLKVKLLDCATEIETTILRSTNLIYFVLILFIFYEIKYYFEGSIFLGGGHEVASKGNRLRRFADTTLPGNVSILVPIDVSSYREKRILSYTAAQISKFK